MSETDNFASNVILSLRAFHRVKVTPRVIWKGKVSVPQLDSKCWHHYGNRESLLAPSVCKHHDTPPDFSELLIFAYAKNK